MRTLIAFLLLCSSSLAIDISKEDVIKNEKPGLCMWASLETLGRYHGIKKVYGLKNTRKTPKQEVWKLPEYNNVPYYFTRAFGYPFMVNYEFKKLDIPIKHQRRGIYDRNICKKANKIGAAICLERGSDINPHECHVVILTEYTDDYVRFVDTNTPDRVIKKSREWFDYWWNGEAFAYEFR